MPGVPEIRLPVAGLFPEIFSDGAERCYAVTLSAQLSGSYNSAVLGANLAQEENEDLKIHVFNSRSASIGETLIVKKIVECEEAGMSFERVVETVELYISTQHTYFVLENLETLRKNGRLSKTKALVASALKIKPVMGATSEGDIVQLDQARGINKALMKMVDAIVNDAKQNACHLSLQLPGARRDGKRSPSGAPCGTGCLRTRYPGRQQYVCK